MDEPWASVPRTELLFVYGTLRRGQANHGQLGKASYGGETWIDGVDLHDLGPFPMAIGGSGRVHGELYLVDLGQLEQLDRFEGAPRLYQRRQWTLPDGRLAWIYLGQPRQVRHSPRLIQGRWPLLALTASVIPLLPACLRI